MQPGNVDEKAPEIQDADRRDEPGNKIVDRRRLCLRREDGDRMSTAYRHVPRKIVSMARTPSTDTAMKLYSSAHPVSNPMKLRYMPPITPQKPWRMMSP